MALTSSSHEACLSEPSVPLNGLLLQAKLNASTSTTFPAHLHAILLSLISALPIACQCSPKLCLFTQQRLPVVVCYKGRWCEMVSYSGFLSGQEQVQKRFEWLCCLSVYTPTTGLTQLVALDAREVPCSRRRLTSRQAHGKPHMQLHGR